MAIATVADVPARPDGLELIGEMEGSGYRTPPALVRRQDGQTFQLTPLLYAVLEAVDGRRGFDDIARHASERTGRQLTATDIQTLAERQLRPRGLLRNADGSEVPLERSNPLTGLRLKLAVTDPVLTRRITQPFAALFHPLVWIPVLAAFAVVAGWLLFERGLASAAYQAFAKPDLLALVLVVTILSAGFHEFGHAAAARRGGGQPGTMGAGWFLLWPAFYTDVTDTYRLGRTARIRTDLGGLYFNAIVAVGIAVAWWFSGWDALLLVIAAQILQMIRQLAPLVRFDGYHVLADVTGVPDLFSRIGPILTSFWPGRWNDPRVAQLKPWVRIVVTLWVLIVVPLLLFAVIALVLAAPRLIGTALESLGREWARLGDHLAAGEALDAIGAGLAMAVISLPVIAIGFVFGRVAFGIARGLWRRTEGRPVRRGGAGVLAIAVAAALAIAWWPTADRYQPIRPYEDGTILSVARVPRAAAGWDVEPEPAATAAGGEVLSVLPAGATLPTEAEPQPALVLIPRSSSGAPADGASEPAWIFPFDRPLPPEPGDNQAVAVNTEDGTVTYDVAIAMVWVTDDNPVLNTNEAYAFASCSDCAAVAVAFQVVVIVGSADVIIPQNLSAAANYECFECITASIASQLVVTVDALPTDEQELALAEIWAEIMAWAATIPTLPLADVISQLEDYKADIMDILGVTPGDTSPSASAEESAAESSDPETTPTPRPTTAPRSSPAPATPGASQDTGATPAPTPAPTAAPTPTPRPPSPTPSPSPTPAPS